MDQLPSADEVLQQMQTIRRNLRPEVDGIVSNAKDLVDWRYYVKSFPWGSLATATALGYLAVPRRLEVISPDAKTLESLAKQHKLVVEPQSRVESKPGLVESALNLTGNMLLRAGLAYVGQQAGRIFGEQAAEEPVPDRDWGGGRHD